jgi:hypothetical protein
MSHMTGAQVRILWNMFALCAGAFSLSIMDNLHAFLTTHTVVSPVSAPGRLNYISRSSCYSMSPTGRLKYSSFKFH